MYVKLHNNGKWCRCVLQTTNDRLAQNSKVIHWQKKAETVLRGDTCTVTPQIKDVTPEDKVSLKSILNNYIIFI